MNQTEETIRSIAAAGERTCDPRVNFNTVMKALRGAVLLLDDAEITRQSHGRTIKELRDDLRASQDDLARAYVRLGEPI